MASTITHNFLRSVSATDTNIQSRQAQFTLRRGTGSTRVGLLRIPISSNGMPRTPPHRMARPHSSKAKALHLPKMKRHKR